VTPDNWNAGLALHTRAVVLLTQVFRDDLRATPGAAIVATASIAATLGHARTPIYTAAKGAVVALVKSMADDLAPDGVRINAVSPGMIDTPMGRAMSPEARADFERRIMLGRFGEPAEIGRVIRFLLSDEASYIFFGYGDNRRWRADLLDADQRRINPSAGELGRDVSH